MSAYASMLRFAIYSFGFHLRPQSLFFVVRRDGRGWRHGFEPFNLGFRFLHQPAGRSHVAPAVQFDNPPQPSLVRLERLENIRIR